MESHRPYGLGADAVPKSLDRKALFSPGRLSDAERGTILEKYRDALGRVDTQVERLYECIDGDPAFVFTSDHGDEFGEEGYYFHQPQRCRVADALVEVPVAARNVDLPRSELSLLDLAPTLLASQGIEPPAAWDGVRLDRKDAEYAVTIAPWGEDASLAYRNDEVTIAAENAAVSVEAGDTRTTADDEDLPDDLERQLQDLGYVG